MVYDRLGLENQYTSLLGVKIPSITVPIKPGRNLAVIIEVAAMNNRQKKMGFNSAQEFTDRINKYFAESMKNSRGNE
jgi:HPr kinase/phosphorylase